MSNESTHSSGTPTGLDDSGDLGPFLAVPVPARDGSLYRYGVTDGLLALLVDNPYAAFTVRELSRATGAASRSVSQAVDVLEANDVVETAHEGNKRLVSVNRERLSKPDDPVLGIPQAEFHVPVRTACDRLLDALDDVRGVVAYGSVARGEADRQSDVDLWVLVASEQATNQRRAHEVASGLGEERFSGNRYEFQVLVESIVTADEYGDRLNEVFASGLTLYETEDLRDLKAEVLRRAD